MPPPENAPASPFYQAFGLVLHSFLNIPELLPSAGGTADVEIVEGDVPEVMPNAQETGVRYQAAPGRLLLRVDGIARYLVEDGRRITVRSEPGADADAVRLFLLGTVMGAVLHQRGDLVLHGSAIVAGDAAVGFLGRSGVGKSTLAMDCRRRGYRVLTDDLCVVRPNPAGILCAEPGFPQSKLWLDSLQQLDLSADGLRRIRSELEKRALPIGESLATQASPLRQLYILQTERNDEITLEPVEGAVKFGILRHHTYRFRYLGGMGGRAKHLGHAANLARQAAITLVRRPAHQFKLQELADRLEAEW